MVAPLTKRLGTELKQILREQRSVVPNLFWVSVCSVSKRWPLKGDGSKIRAKLRTFVHHVKIRGGMGEMSE